MKIGFVDCATNQVDAFDALTKIAQEKVAGAQLDRLTAPDLLKIPLCARKLISSGSENVIVFLTLSEDDLDAMALVHEKIIDVELQQERYVLFCIVSDDEYSDPESLERLIEERFDTVLELASQLELSPSQVSSFIGDTAMAAELAALAGFASSQQKDDAPKDDAEPGTDEEQGSLLF